MRQQVYFVGSEVEIAHHAAPLSPHVDFRIVAPETVADTAKAGDLAIFLSEHFDRFRSAIGRLKDQSVATCYMIDGILEWRNAWKNRGDEPACPFTMRPVLADKVACIGAAQARVLAAWGNAGKIEVVGIPRLDPLCDSVKRVPREGGSTRLLVMTAKCPSYTDADRETLHRSLRDIRDVTDRLKPEVEVLWRLTAGWDQKLGVRGAANDFTGRELAEQLLQVDAVISTPSTAALESMLLDIPTAIVDYSNSPAYVRSAWTTTAASQLEDQLADLLNPPESKLAFQRQMLADELVLDAHATTRMVRLIEGMLRVSRTCLDAGRPIEFPEPVLEVPGGIAAKLPGFNHAALFPEFPEFQNEDRVGLQAELAHTRREIEHLNRQLRQLQSELGQAHQIFDTINGHPIAGPVVRVRRWLLDSIKRLKNNQQQPKEN